MKKLNQTGIFRFVISFIFITFFAFVGAKVASSSHIIGYGNPADIVTPTQSLTNQLEPLTNRSQQTATSRNWAGYAVYSTLPKTKFRAVQATWVQPKITCAAKPAWMTFWVGLDGWTNGNVEQAGSEAYCLSSSGPPIYNIWWEVYPNYTIQIVQTINPGDTINAIVMYNPANNTITMSVKDVTTGQSFVHNEVCTGQFTCPRTSAEIVTEDVYGSNNYYLLPNYGKVTFTKVAITDSEPKTGPIASTSWRDVAITEQAGGIKYASVSPLNTQVNAFNTTWLHQ